MTTPVPQPQSQPNFRVSNPPKVGIVDVDVDTKADDDGGVKKPLPSKFQTPDHPSVKLLQKIRSEKEREAATSSPSPPPPHPFSTSSTISSKSSSSDSTSVSPSPPPPPYENRDPHQQPSFTSESVAHPVYPILYLPPLISSLPDVPPPPFTATASDNTAASDTTDDVEQRLTSSAPLDQTQSSPKLKRENERELPKVLTTETRLPAIDPVSLSLHRALHHFRPVDTNYASTPYADAFNWGELRLPVEEEREWYCVAFRSRRKEGSNGDALYEADKKAHEEAVQNGGLLMYWYGVPDPTTGLNLATCIWQSKAHAAAANSRPHHIRAMRLAKDSYEVYTLERHVLTKKKGCTGVEIGVYEGGEVGW